jgi:predicted RNA-binding Zn ribbon-like protein
MRADVPPELWLVESFLNSVDVESARDDLDTLPRFRRWLGDHRQPAAAAMATEDDLGLAREIRAELRAEVLGHHTPGARDRSRLDALAAGVGLVARFDADGGVRLAGADAGVRGMLGEVLATVVRAAHGGTWARLKICSSDTCRYVFYDRSKNGSRRWCSMDVCGNRSKTRSYRERRGASPTRSSGVRRPLAVGG